MTDTAREAADAADLASALPTDHPLARLARLRLAAAVARQHQEHTMTDLAVQDLEDAASVAEQEAIDAELAADALEELVREGDDTVDVAQIEAQRSAARFAGLRAVAARRKAVTLAESTHQDHLAEVRNGFAAALGDPVAYSATMTSALATLSDDVTAAVQKVLDVVEVRAAKVRTLIAQAREVGVPVRVPSSPFPAPAMYVADGMSHPTIVVDGVPIGTTHGLVTAQSLSKVVADAVGRAVKAGAL